LQPYFEATGLAPLTVEPGTLFQPETMEPGGTVVLPDRPLEEVASVMRRGYALNGEQLRPIQVEVVVHTQPDSPE
jgi:molecular chaperone GrpE (heat shock protein)